MISLHSVNEGYIYVILALWHEFFTGELVRFQAGVTLEISRIDVWYSNSHGDLEGPAAFILRGLCRRCCIPEVALRCMQVVIFLSLKMRESLSNGNLF